MHKWAGGLLTMSLLFLVACTAAVGENAESRDLDVRVAWSGDYPVGALDQLPAGQQRNRVGVIHDAATFTRVWPHFHSGEALPLIDFARELVVFSRNVDFYNRTNIFKVTLTDGVVEVLAMETLSAKPVTDQVAMAMAVVPRSGIRALRVDADHVAPID